MANKNIFKSETVSKSPTVNTVNKAGGVAYDLGNESALAQYVVTGTLNQTYYAGATEQVDEILRLAALCDTKFVAQAAVYAHKVARMKDTPALLANVLANREAEGLTYLEAIFPQVITGTKMLRNFAQILRSGKVGRKSFGSAVKRMIVEWLQAQSADSLFKGSVGNDPSLADVVRMVHPRPADASQEAFYGWLLGKGYSKDNLPATLKAFEAFKQGDNRTVPEVDFRMLTALPLSTAQWAAIARNASWNALRMNLNTFQRHGCFNDKVLVTELAQKLKDANSVRKANAFPYQLLTTYQATVGTIPMELSLALQDALEVATLNVPELSGGVAVLVDVSGSMASGSVTGIRTGATSVTKPVDVAALIASSLLRVNPTAVVVPFDTCPHKHNLNPRDSVMTNATKLAKYGGGGTDCGSALAHLNALEWMGNTVIFVSDNESWFRPYGYSRTNTMVQWELYKKRNRKAKLICIDLQPGSTTQVADGRDVLNIGGFTDSVFTVIENFVNHDSQDFAKVIKDAVHID